MAGLTVNAGALAVTLFARARTQSLKSPSNSWVITAEEMGGAMAASPV